MLHDIDLLLNHERKIIREMKHRNMDAFNE